MTRTPRDADAEFDDLLGAAISATPAERGRRRWPRRLGAGLLVAALLAGGYTAAAALAPLPELRAVPAPALAGEAALAGPAAPELAPGLPTAVGWLEGEAVVASDPHAHPIASLSKLVTVLVALDRAPVPAGEDGPSYTVGPVDAEYEAAVLADDGVAHPTPAGLQLSTRQLIQLALLPSSNNYTLSYAHSVFGSPEAFREAVAAWAAEHGLGSLHLEEPTGLDERNVASAADLVRVARLALRTPIIAETTRLAAVELPEIGRIDNTNPLLGQPGVIGLKTGTTLQAGSSLIAARAHEVAGRDLTEIVVVLGRPDADTRAADAAAQLAALAEIPAEAELVAAGQEVGHVDTWTGARVPLLAADPIAATLLPGERAALELKTARIGAAAGGTPVGSVRAQLPGGGQRSIVIAADPVDAPDLRWRMTHPGAVLGWLTGSGTLAE